MEWEGSGRYSNVVWGPRVDCGSGKNKHVTCVGRKRCLKRAMIHSGSWIYCWSSSLSNIHLGEEKKKCNKRYYKHKNQWQKQPLQTRAKSMRKEGAWIFPTRITDFFSSPPSECPPELAAAGHLCACRIWCYRKHRHSRYTDCPRCL